MRTIDTEEKSRWLSHSSSPLSSIKQIANASIVYLAVRCLLTSNAFLLLILPAPDAFLLRCLPDDTLCCKSCSREQLPGPRYVRPKVTASVLTAAAPIAPSIPEPPVQKVKLQGLF